jgi:hypothetical protein
MAVTACGCVGKAERFRGTYYVLLQGSLMTRVTVLV